MKARRLILACALTALGLAASPAQSFTWPLNGVNLAWPASSPYDVHLVPDGEQGAIFAWWDYRDGANHVIVQRTTGHGRVLWGDSGIIVAPGATSQALPRIVSDGAGGAVVVWVDYRNGNLDVFAQRFDADGNRLWTIEGVPVVVWPESQSSLAVVGDGYGGAIVAWLDDRNAGKDVYAQRITASGDVAWADGGVAICTATDIAEGLAVASDALGGAVVAWTDYRAGPVDADIYARRVSYYGSVLWNVDGVPVCTAANIQNMVSIVEDGAGGVILAWMDGRGGADLYGQRIDAYGTTLWTANGSVICAGVGQSVPPRTASDAAGGAFVVWEQGLSGDSDVRAQRISGAGTPFWAAPGVPVCSLPSLVRDPQVEADGVGGAIVAWYDYRATYADIYAQRLDDAGADSWTAGGVAVCSANGHQYYPALTTDGAGGVIVAWQDGRDQSPRMAAQRVDRHGYWGYPSPDIRYVRDVPGDQGGSVVAAWYASRLDPWPAMEIAGYTVWRAVPPAVARTNLAAAKARVVSADAVAGEVGGVSADGGVPVYRLEALTGRTFFWELVASRDAYHLSGYAATVPTLYDSTDASPATQYFQVIAHATDPSRFWISAPDSGVSVDNLAPAAPQALAGRLQYSPAGLALNWSPNTEADLERYALYRGGDPDFVPDPGNLVATVADTAYFDADCPTAGAWYKLTARDTHGNESASALLDPDRLTPVGDGSPPPVTRLEANVPNPFNPSTRLVFTLRERILVELRIHDAAGRLVRDLAVGERPSGRNEVTWDGRDAAGREAASGVYYCRLAAGDYRETRKIALVR
ncbi:MAG: FlgD immunoglobulin-like domain containing protein [bacterium]|nr:FlgD immunoglobulin-like domain containing protein [bacterium]